MADSPKVISERRGRTLVVTINRPDVRNCVDGETAQGLFEAVDSFRRDDALDALHECSSAEGILPALESSHALAGAKRWAASHPGARIVVGLSGRGDKDIQLLTGEVPHD